MNITHLHFTSLFILQ